MADDRTLPRIDTTRAHPARVYDFWLGGSQNFEADREAGKQLIAAGLLR